MKNNIPKWEKKYLQVHNRELMLQFSEENNKQIMDEARGTKDIAHIAMIEAKEAKMGEQEKLIVTCTRRENTKSKTMKQKFTLCDETLWKNLYR